MFFLARLGIKKHLNETPLIHWIPLTPKQFCLLLECSERTSLSLVIFSLISQVLELKREQKKVLD
jgi:hypothetical protein